MFGLFPAKGLKLYNRRAENLRREAHRQTVVSLVTESYKPRPLWDTSHSHCIRVALIKTGWERAPVGEDLEKVEDWGVVGGQVRWCLEKQYGSVSES